MNFKDDAEFLSEIAAFMRKYKLMAPLYALLHSVWFIWLASGATSDNWIWVGLILLMPSFLLAHFLQQHQNLEAWRYAVIITAAITLLTWGALFMDKQRNAIELTVIVHTPMILLWVWRYLCRDNGKGAL